MNILIIGNIEGEGGLKNRMDKNIYNFMNYLKNNSKYNIILFDSSEKDNLIQKNDKNNIIFVLPGCKLPFINLLEGIKIYNMMDVTCRCCYKCIGDNDNCRSKELVNYLKNNHYEHLFYTYHTYIFKYQYNFMEKQYFFPHFIDNNVFKDYQLEKKYDILFFGNDWIKFYPLRNKLKKLLSKTKFNYYIVDYSNPKIGEDLAKLINQSWITFCTKSINNLLFSKYIETGLCKSVICGDFPDLEDRIFGDNMIYIDNNSDRQIINILEKYLSDKNNLIEMSNKVYDICLEKYTYQQGLITFTKYIDSIIE